MRFIPAALRAKCRAFVAWRTRIAAETRARVFRLSLRAEHWGFVTIAAVDAFHWHSFLFIVSLWLFVTGLAMEFFWWGE